MLYLPIFAQQLLVILIITLHTEPPSPPLPTPVHVSLTSLSMESVWVNMPCFRWWREREKDRDTMGERRICFRYNKRIETVKSVLILVYIYQYS
jgi:hypothetical protein